MTVSVTDVDEPPSAPAVPAVAPVSGRADRLSVTWSAPANAGKPAIRSYDLRYREGATGPWMNGPQGVTGTGATISGLAADTRYEVRVSATNAQGTGGWSPAGSGRIEDARDRHHRRARRAAGAGAGETTG